MAQAATICTRQEDVEFPRTAVAYAVRELARRATVSPDLFRRWQIEIDDHGFVNVFVLPGTNRRIRFPRAESRFWNNLRARGFRTSTATWMSGPGPFPDLLPDFKIPFSTADRTDVGPLFVAEGSGCVECPVDLLASTLLTLARFQETLATPRDEHGRFTAYSSVAWRDGFLHRPIVDEYGLALEQALTYLLPGWRPRERRLRVKLGHDVDEIGIPFNFRSMLGHTLRRRRPAGTLRDLLAPATGIDTTYQLMLRRIVNLSCDRGLDSAVYWKASVRGRNDTGYDPRHPRILSLIEALRSRGIEMGIHPGYETFQSPEKFCAEVSLLRELLGEQRLGGRQDFLRWNPKTWVHWESLGLAYDASVGFADHIGFRAGTSIPFHPWLLSQCREAKLLEIPLLAMDATLDSYMEIDPEEALVRLRDCVARCRAVGGVFTLLWHNTKFFQSCYANIYQRLLDELAGSGRYDWRMADHGTC